MRILYGVQGTGNGHLSRSRELIERLAGRGHEVLALVSGRPAEQVPPLPGASVILHREGLTFVTRGGRVRTLATVRGLGPLRFLRDAAGLGEAVGRPDLAITDFEPVVARWARRAGVECLGIGHQYAFLHPVPRPAGQWIGRGVLRAFAPADRPLGLHWAPFGAPVLPPIVPPLENAAERNDDLVLVYLPFEEPASIVRGLSGLRGRRILVYGHGARPDEGSIGWRAFSREGFLDDLRRCGAVVCNAGFELPSEALALGRRLLVKPLGGQLEQEANALALERLGLGRSLRRLDPAAVARALDRPRPEPRPWGDVAGRLAAWIDGGRRESVAELADAAWREAGRAGNDAPPSSSRRS